jgi:hypothetical protein
MLATAYYWIRIRSKKLWGSLKRARICQKRIDIIQWETPSEMCFRLSYSTVPELYGPVHAQFASAASTNSIFTPIGLPRPRPHSFSWTIGFCEWFSRESIWAGWTSTLKDWDSTPVSWRLLRLPFAPWPTGWQFLSWLCPPQGHFAASGSRKKLIFWGSTSSEVAAGCIGWNWRFLRWASRVVWKEERFQSD